jgi:hypothetical protein
MTGIPEGTYELKYTTGLDWQENAETFRWLPSYGRFESQFVYSEERVGNEIQYHEISVTLQPVVRGNVRTVPISREEFLKGEQETSNCSLDEQVSGRWRTDSSRSKQSRS